MIRLLDANFKRLSKNKPFYILMIITIIIAILKIIFSYIDMDSERPVHLEEILCFYPFIFSFFIASFTSLFLGCEYTDSVIRNKISIGHKRLNIYLANLITVSIACLLFYIVYFLVSLIIGLPFFGVISISYSLFLKIIITILIDILAYSSIFTAIQMLFNNNTISIVMNIGIILIFIFSFFVISSIQIDIEYSNQGYSYTEDYKKEFSWKVCETLQNLNLFYHDYNVYHVSSSEDVNYNKMQLSSLGIIVVSTSIGLIIFNKKNLK